MWTRTIGIDPLRSGSIATKRDRFPREVFTIPVPLGARFAAKERALSDPRTTFDGTVVSVIVRTAPGVSACAGVTAEE
ncbi:hypothetical protein Sliba_31130 [Streptomyces nigrescens]|uniref:Uncharacterized protein n=1 Tax=Streptomyces nigrescens TaxID=1920 RepID=A0A640THE1_STRNI|nr:hypothetical protein Sliba_31130 [Streptomyces libani subsp. libani]GGV91481.1 hypothetical protein GCM10010500_21930 [Streptomyces libani subsp. libani]